MSSTAGPASGKTSYKGSDVSFYLSDNFFPTVLQAHRDSLFHKPSLPLTFLCCPKTPCPGKGLKAFFSGPGPITVPCCLDTSLPMQTPGCNLAPRVTARFGSLQVLLCVQTMQTRHSQHDPSWILWAPLCGSHSLRQGQAFPSNTP